MSDDGKTSYPLSWPSNWPRSRLRKPARFHSGKSLHGPGAGLLTIAGALDRLERELGRLGVNSWDVIVSTNLRLGMRGAPISNQPEPPDPGAAVYFRLNKKDRVLACDCWQRTADNVAAIAAHIDAIRRIDRYGVGSLDQAFAGYDALPPPGADNRPPWRGMLGFPPHATVTADDVKIAYRAHAKQAASDQGALLQLNLARDAALAELGG